MSNLAYEASDPQGQMLQFPRKERPTMSDQDEGFTPLPNFICDEGYLAVLDGDAIKCLVFLNRHIRGFHIESKGMSETLIKKITGIKDGRTIQKYMGQLAHYQLVKIEKERGKSNVYHFTFDDRLPTQHVGTFNDNACDVPTQHVGTPPTQYVGGSTYMPCRSVKEIYLKENNKEREEEESAQENPKFTPQNRQLNFIEYHTSDRTPISLKELFKKYPAQLDFFDQAKASFPNHSDEQIFNELKKLAQWSLSASNLMPQKWMTTWLNWMQKVPTAAENDKAEQRKATAKSKPQNPKYHQYGQPQPTNSMRDVGGKHE